MIVWTSNRPGATPKTHQPHQPHGVKEFQAKWFILEKYRGMGLMGWDGVEGGIAVAAFFLVGSLSPGATVSQPAGNICWTQDYEEN
jgi:hypothetical protein